MSDARKGQKQSRLIGASGEYQVWADALNFTVTHAGRTVGHYRTLPAALRCVVYYAVRRGIECPELSAVAASVERIVSAALTDVQRIAEGTSRDGYGWSKSACGACGETGMQTAGDPHAAP